MITKEQVQVLAKKNKIDETTIFREYLQIFFLNKLYSKKKSEKVFFKGGTALHLIYQMPRFSEDLDFTVEMNEERFLIFIENLFEETTKEEKINFKGKSSLIGRKFLLTAEPDILSYKVFVSLDFSFREKIICPEKSIIKTDYPVLFRNYVNHPSKEEIFAEKIRALLTRDKGRDLYDIWYLLNQGVSMDKKLVQEKLKYYNLEDTKEKEIKKKIEKFSLKDFILDLRPFVPENEREKLADFFEYAKDYLLKNI